MGLGLPGVDGLCQSQNDSMIPPTYINYADERLLRRLLRRELRGKIIDVGCGNAVLKKYLSPDTTYTGIDAQAGLGVDVVADVHRLPFPDNSFDGALCTSVLEHVEDERKVVGEIFRVVRPGGKVVITIPFMLHYHKDPEDYRRLTHAGLQDLLEKQGFRQVTTHFIPGVFTVVEFAFFSVLVHAKREGLFTRRWYLFPYYVLVGVLWIVSMIFNYITAPIQRFDDSMYVGVAAVATK